MPHQLSADAEISFLVKCQHMEASERQSLADTFAQYASRTGVPQELRECAKELESIARSSGGKGTNWVRG